MFRGACAICFHAGRWSCGCLAMSLQWDLSLAEPSVLSVAAIPAPARLKHLATYWGSVTADTIVPVQQLPTSVAGSQYRVAQGMFRLRNNSRNVGARSDEPMTAAVTLFSLFFMLYLELRWMKLVLETLTRLERDIISRSLTSDSRKKSILSRLRTSHNLRDKASIIKLTGINKSRYMDILEGMVNRRRVRSRRRYQMIDDIKIYGSYEEKEKGRK
ncbi:hypothetical protein ANN_22313 [Periplaneta americana]|uniref:Uncharacterized protein n=1 Tax=Periplaneta americana TaxID=6978 RepID=A0ABQ8S846_PERAM|nr:hypothetical protein ANN_22313 [Periplaneta americana]